VVACLNQRKQRRPTWMRGARWSRFQSHVTAAPKKMIRIMQPPRRGLILERYDDLSRSHRSGDQRQRSHSG